MIEATSDVVTHAGEDEAIGGPVDGEPDLVRAARDARGTTRRSATSSPSSSARARTSCSPTTPPRSRGTLLADDPSVTALGFLYRAVDHVRSSLEYRLGTTTVNSSVAEVLEGGSGVCQDFAHVLISLCRNVGLPARYVSGYLGGVEESDARRTPGPRRTCRRTAGSASTPRSARAAPGAT